MNKIKYTKYTNQELITIIDLLQVWGNAHSCNKYQLLKQRKQYIKELQSRYIDNKLLKYLI